MIKSNSAAIDMVEIPPDLAPRLQLSQYRQETGAADTIALVKTAIAAGCPGVSVHPVFVADAARASEQKTSIVGRVSHFGMAKPTIKAIEAASCIKDGASEILVEPLLAPQLAGDFSPLKAELLEVARAARATGRDVLLHVNLRTMLLNQRGGEAWVEAACRAVREGAFDGITDIGDDASHALVRTHAGPLILRRCMPAVKWDDFRRLLHPSLDRVEVFVELMGIKSLGEILR